MNHAKVIAIMGPTASGKTAAALAIAREFDAEIISVDSALVYRDMDIGTAKPSALELATVPHHLIDIIDPALSYSVAQFLIDTERLVRDITARGKLPILAGGTMMYFKALMNGLDDLPGADLAIRARLDAEAIEIGVSGLHQRLQALDPVTAARLKPNDSQRVQRALEIIAISGEPMSTLIARQPKKARPFEMLSISLEPSDRSALHQRISRRFDTMLELGFLDEVRQLRQRGDLHADLPSMRCVGYRQAWEHLDGLHSHAEMRELGIIASRQLAKRQLTWLRSIPERIIIDCLGRDPNTEIVDIVGQALRNTAH
jgi:tRNA dimethylallyltransferase